MARPSRCRRICLEPEWDTFSPSGIVATGSVCLTLDEFEAMRLIDYEKKTQAEAARQMDISRTTVAEIYDRARFKLADCLLNGKSLRISGGNYRFCDGSTWPGCGRYCHKAGHDLGLSVQYREGRGSMKIAVTYENGAVFQHFGHTAQFKTYDVEDGKVVNSSIVDTSGSGHGALAGLLAKLGVDTLICGGLGAGAQMALKDAGINLYAGVTGKADDAVNALLAGTLVQNTAANCHHHGNQGHSCGEEKHGCGGNGGSNHG